MAEHKIAVCIPCFKVKKHILEVIKKIPAMVTRIYVIDDCCPEKSGHYVQENCEDHRVKVLYNDKNQGVGGAVIVGYQESVKEEIHFSYSIQVYFCLRSFVYL